MQELLTIHRESGGGVVMSPGKRSIILIAGLAFLIAAAEFTFGVLANHRLATTESPSVDPFEAPGWREIELMDAALARGDVHAAVRARQSAHQRAMGARGWRVMLAVGDATVRLEEVTGNRAVALSEARRAYLVGLFRARQEGSLEGMLGAARAFAALGDRDMVEGALAIAADLATRSQDPDASGQVREVAVRLAFAEASDVRR
jgi:hypothetical protein